MGVAGILRRKLKRQLLIPSNESVMRGLNSRPCFDI